MGGTNWNFGPWGSRIQVYDATFGFDATDPIRLPFRGSLTGAITDPACLTPVTTGTPPNTTTTTTCQFWVDIPSLPGNREFDDMTDYWFAETQASGVITPKTGTTIRVVNTNKQGEFMKVEVNSALAPVE